MAALSTLPRRGNRRTKLLAGVLAGAVLALGGATATAGSAAAADRSTIATIANDQVGNGCSPYAGACSVDWCAIFAEWVWRQAGVTDIPTTAVARGVGQWGVDHNLFHEGDPKPGDLAVFGAPANATGGHVAVVSAVNSNGTITTINGNFSGSSPSNSHVVKTTIDPKTYKSGASNVLISGYVSPPGVTDGSAPETRSKVRWADINGDGKDDYLVLNDNGSVRAFVNKGGDGHGGWTDYGQIASGLTTDRSRVRFADINGDGKDDYLVINPNGSVKAFLNNGGDGHGGWTDYGQIASGLTTNADAVRFADIDGDGKADYVVINDNGSVKAFLNKGGDGHGGWSDYGQIASGMTTDRDHVRFADINGDKKADYVLINANGSIRAFVSNGGDGHGGWTDYGQIASGMTSNANQVRFTDVGGDSKADYVVVNTNGSIRAFVSNGGDGHGGWTDYGQIASGMVTE